MKTKNEYENLKLSDLKLSDLLKVGWCGENYNPEIILRGKKKPDGDSFKPADSEPETILSYILRIKRHKGQ